MTALKTAPGSNKTSPLNKRRVWAHPELRSHSLLVLTLDRMYLAPLSGAPKAELVAAVEAGVDLDDHLGPLATVIEISTIQRARLNLLTNTLVLMYNSAGMGKGSLRLEFATPETADACFTKIWRRLGEGAELLSYRRDLWTLIRMPLVIMIAILILTAGLALALNMAEELSASRAVATINIPVGSDSSSSVRVAARSPFESLSGWLDPRVVCAVGGAAAAVVQVWLYRRYSQPPKSLEVVKTAN